MFYVLFLPYHLFIPPFLLSFSFLPLLLSLRSLSHSFHLLSIPLYSYSCLLPTLFVLFLLFHLLHHPIRYWISDPTDENDIDTLLNYQGRKGSRRLYNASMRNISILYKLTSTPNHPLHNLAHLFLLMFLYICFLTANYLEMRRTVRSLGSATTPTAMVTTTKVMYYIMFPDYEGLVHGEIIKSAMVIL